MRKRWSGRRNLMLIAKLLSQLKMASSLSLQRSSYLLKFRRKLFRRRNSLHLSLSPPSVSQKRFLKGLGIGRIVYCIFEHCFRVREEDAQRTYFVFPPLVAPVKCSILPLMDKPDLNVVVQSISKAWWTHNSRAHLDKSWHLFEDWRFRLDYWQEIRQDRWMWHPLRHNCWLWYP